MDGRIKSRSKIGLGDSTSHINLVDRSSGTSRGIINFPTSKVEDSTFCNENKSDDASTASDWKTDIYDRDIPAYPDLEEEEASLRESICDGFRNILSKRDPDETELDEYVLKIQKKYGFMYLGAAITEIYIEFYNRPAALQTLCSSLIRFDMDEVKPWGQSLILGLINHPDDSVKESVVELIDNWSSTFMINALKTISISSTWLNQYVIEVVSRLENSDVLHKKIN